MIYRNTLQLKHIFTYTQSHTMYQFSTIIYIICVLLPYLSRRYKINLPIFYSDLILLLFSLRVFTINRILHLNYLTLFAHSLPVPNTTSTPTIQFKLLISVHTGCDCRSPLTSIRFCCVEVEGAKLLRTLSLHLLEKRKIEKSSCFSTQSNI